MFHELVMKRLRDYVAAEILPTLELIANLELRASAKVNSHVASCFLPNRLLPRFP